MHSEIPVTTAAHPRLTTGGLFIAWAEREATETHMAATSDRNIRRHTCGSYPLNNTHTHTLKIVVAETRDGTTEHQDESTQHQSIMMSDRGFYAAVVNTQHAHAPYNRHAGLQYKSQLHSS